MTPKTKTTPKLYKLQSNDLDDRIEMLQEEINRGKRSWQVRQIAANVVRGVPSRDWEQEAKELFEWTRKKIRYTLDPDNVELFQSADRSIEVGIGDCDDQSIVLGVALKAARWRLEPATEKQLGILDMYHVAYDSTITKGEASDVIDVIFAGEKATVH